MGRPAVLREPLHSGRWPIRWLWNVLPKYTIANALWSCQLHAVLGGHPPHPSVPATLLYPAAKRSKCGWFGARKHLFDENFKADSSHSPTSRQPQFLGSGWHFASPSPPQGLLSPTPSWVTAPTAAVPTPPEHPWVQGDGGDVLGGGKAPCAGCPVSARSVVPRRFWGITGWGCAVKSESRPAENNDFIYCMSICDSS